MLLVRLLALSLAFAAAPIPVAGADEPPAGGGADEPPPMDAAPPAASPVPAADSTPAASAVTDPAASVSAGVERRSSFTVHAHLSLGVEPHERSCADDRSGSCEPMAFGVGGQLLWQNLVGLGLGLYAREGSPLLSGSDTQLGLGDRVSVAASLALRPFAYSRANRDNFLANVLSIELGPSLEYTRTAAASLANCPISPTAIKPGFHGMFSFEVPLVGNARQGWISLRAAARLSRTESLDLAPRAPKPSEVGVPCVAQVRDPGTSTQVLFGLGFYL